MTNLLSMCESNGGRNQRPPLRRRTKRVRIDMLRESVSLSRAIRFIEGGARFAPRAFLAGLVLQPDRTVSATIARPSDTRRRRELLDSFYESNRRSTWIRWTRKHGIVVGVVILALIAIAALLVYQKRQSHRLEQRFGPEYRRAVNDLGSKT